MYVYRMKPRNLGTDPVIWEAGRITDKGRWEHDSTHATAQEAAQRASELNSGRQDFNVTTTQERTQ